MCHDRVTVAQRVTCHVRSEVFTAVVQMTEVFCVARSVLWECHKRV